MKASELVAQLQALIAEHGDLDVLSDTDCGFDPVTTVRVSDDSDNCVTDFWEGEPWRQRPFLCLY